MRILWLISISLPEASLLLDKEISPLGGWLINASQDLSNQEDMELSILFPSDSASEFSKLEGKKINYYPFDPIGDDETGRIEEDEHFKRVLQEIKPDIVHIYGSETAHTLAMVNICKREDITTVISIQGLVSIIQKHMFADLPFRAVYGLTLKNLLRKDKDNVIGLKKTFSKRGINEVKAIQNTNHIIGRTSWDKACTSQMNPKAEYHFCNETLREEFYKHSWDIDRCEKYSIFLSQGEYSIKGLHYLLEALPLILKRFPQTKVYISGEDITKADTIKEKLRMTYYGKYIKREIKKLDIGESIIFTGSLDEEKMCERYLKSHIFVCPSSIENSSNSLGEAMILGLPCVASYVGGIPDMLEDREEGFLYQHNASYMLAYNVCKIFQDDDLARKLSGNTRARALKTHDKDENTRRLLEIYRDIVGD